MSALTDTVSADMPFTPERGHALYASWSKWHFNQCPRAFTIYWHYKQYFKEWNVCLLEQDQRVLTAPGELCPPPKPFLAPALDAGHSQEARDSTTVKGEDG